jgi:hypothetical protein
VLKVDTLRSFFSRPAFVLVLLAAAFGIGFAQNGSVTIVENAQMKSNGNGWECNAGYREVGNGCIVDNVTRVTRPGERDRAKSREAADFLKLERENARLRREIAALALRNAVLTAEAGDYR